MVGGPAAAAAGPSWEAWLVAWLSSNAVLNFLNFVVSPEVPAQRNLPSQAFEFFSMSPGWLLPPSCRTSQCTYWRMGRSKANGPGKMSFVWGKCSGSGNGPIPVGCHTVRHLYICFLLRSMEHPMSGMTALGSLGRNANPRHTVLRSGKSGRFWFGNGIFFTGYMHLARPTDI